MLRYSRYRLCLSILCVPPKPPQKRKVPLSPLPGTTTQPARHPGAETFAEPVIPAQAGIQAPSLPGKGPAPNAVGAPRVAPVPRRANPPSGRSYVLTA